jgi:hypothetical protein
MTIDEAISKIHDILEGRPFRLIAHVLDASGEYCREAAWHWTPNGQEGVASAGSWEDLVQAVKECEDDHFRAEETRAKIQRDINEDKIQFQRDNKADMDRDDRRDAAREDFRHMGEGD